VQIDTDFFVIETYQQLLAVMGVVAGVVVLVVVLLRWSRRNRKALQAAPAISVATRGHHPTILTRSGPPPMSAVERPSGKTRPSTPTLG